MKDTEPLPRFLTPEEGHLPAIRISKVRRWAAREGRILKPVRPAVCPLLGAA